MKKISFTFCLLFFLFNCTAQTDVAQLHETAKSFMRQGDYANAILVLNRATQQDPQNIAITKNLALSYYFQKDNKRALEIIKPVLEKDDADDQSFQIAANVYQQLEMVKECEKLYKKAIRKFPDSGPLYNDYGELLWVQKNFEAIKQWEKGIEVDPTFSRNYYNAAKYYYFTIDKVWSILYGEIFINMEPFGKNTPEIKDMLLDGYKKLFADANLEQNNKDKNPFVIAYLQSMNKQSSVAAQGINAESLTMIRTRFVLDWTTNNKSKFPYRLFEYQQQLLQEGLFDAYNQWIFGSSENLPAFQNWTVTHKDDYTAFTNFQKGRIFKIPIGQGHK